MPKYFEHKNYASFQRALNFHGFKSEKNIRLRGASGQKKVIYCHPQWQRQNQGEQLISKFDCCRTLTYLKILHSSTNSNSALSLGIVRDMKARQPSKTSPNFPFPEHPDLEFQTQFTPTKAPSITEFSKTPTVLSRRAKPVTIHAPSPDGKSTKVKRLMGLYSLIIDHSESIETVVGEGLTTLLPPDCSREAVRTPSPVFQLESEPTIECNTQPHHIIAVRYVSFVYALQSTSNCFFSFYVHATASSKFVHHKARFISEQLPCRLQTSIRGYCCCSKSR